MFEWLTENIDTILNATVIIGMIPIAIMLFKEIKGVKAANRDRDIQDILKDPNFKKGVGIIIVETIDPLDKKLDKLNTTMEIISFKQTSAATAVDELKLELKNNQGHLIKIEGIIDKHILEAIQKDTIHELRIEAHEDKIKTIRGELENMWSFIRNFGKS